MPYVSLYRKYRSQTFDDVIGQEHVVRTIRNAIDAGRIGQGYLFCGSRGTGKTTLARLIAKALNCQSQSTPTSTPCNVCEACLSITQGAAVDVIEMDAASNRSVDDVDMLRDGVKYPPMRLRYKVYIIDEAHQLSPQAKDAFLKTLEEPPPHAVFILATTEAQKIPLTIRSRCQQFDFRRGTVDEIGGRLRQVAEGENAEIEDEAVELISRSAGGSYRDSLSLLEQVMGYTEGRITAKDVSVVLGLVEEDVLLEVGDVLSARDTAAAFAVADRLMREGRDARELLKSLAAHFRDLLALKVGADPRRAGNERWRAQAENFSQERLVRIIDEFSAAEKDLKWNDQHRLGLEMALLRAMARPSATAAVSPAVQAAAPAQAAVPRPEPVAQPVPAEPEVEQQPVTEAKPKPAKAKPEAAVEPAPEPPPVVPDSRPTAQDAGPETGPDAGPEVTLADVQKAWPKMLVHLHKTLKQPNAAALVREGHPVDVSGSVLKIGFTKKWNFHRNKLEEQYATFLQQALLAVVGAKLKITTVLLEDSEAPSVSKDAPEPEVEAIQHPLLDDVLAMGGRIVDDDKDPWEGDA